MTNVRLTATTPDGEVVPVLSNTKGELLLESPIAPPEFDGNLEGDLSVSGSGTFAGDVQFGGDPNLGVNTGIKLYPAQGSICATGNVAGQNLFLGFTEKNSTSTVAITAGGSAEFASGAFHIDSLGIIQTNVSTVGTIKIDSAADFVNPNILLKATDGSAVFAGDVVIGSRGTKWLIRESNGVAMLVEQTRRGKIEPRDYEKVRDLPRELDLVEAALNEIMEKLKMTPPAGWEVWDGSDDS